MPKKKDTSALVAKRLARAQAIVERVRVLKGRIDEAFYEIGELLAEAQRDGLHVALRMASFAAYAKSCGVDKTTAYELVKVVEAVPRDIALPLGIDKAAALAAYVKATKTVDDARSVVRNGVEVGRGKTRPLADVTAGELSALAQKARDANGAARTKRDDERAAVAKRARPVGAWLKKWARKGKLSTVRKAASWWVRIELPLEDAERLTKR